MKPCVEEGRPALTLNTQGFSSPRHSAPGASERGKPSCFPHRQQCPEEHPHPPLDPLAIAQEISRSHSIFSPGSYCVIGIQWLCTGEG